MRWADEVTIAYHAAWAGLSEDTREMLRDVKVYAIDRDSLAYGMFDPKERAMYFYGGPIRATADPGLQLELTVHHEIEHALGWWHTEASHSEMGPAWTSAWYGRGPLTVKLKDETLVTLPGR